MMTKVKIFTGLNAIPFVTVLAILDKAIVDVPENVKQEALFGFDIISDEKGGKEVVIEISYEIR